MNTRCFASAGDPDVVYSFEHDLAGDGLERPRTHMVASPDVLEIPEPIEVASFELAEPAEVATPLAPVRKARTPGKVYAGRFVSGRRLVVVRGLEGNAPLRCLDFNTPTFAWGYHGGAPEELAIAILHDYLGSPSLTVESRVLQLYRSFVDEIVSKFDYEGAWSMTEGTVAKWIAGREARAKLER